ncbi:hypothetical protein [Massilia timonae]|uniref:hypothetical protein n=1 Tax=Massilia timonae TaxID=47229 RepID=UPI0028B26588|nr:hypothetical protein [Massilia timonae]
MIERGILFKGAMVRALLDGAKTQTRRVMKKQPYLSRRNPPEFSDTKPGDIFVCPDFLPTSDAQNSVLVECERLGVYHCMGQREFAAKHSPYGQPGDRLWVRETFMDLEGTGVEHRDSEGLRQRYAYAADNRPGSYGDEARKDYGLKWKPSIHMPRTACRILLEIMSVRVERLQDISEADADAEGCERLDVERYDRDPTLCPKCDGLRLHRALGPGGGVIEDVDCAECETYVKRYRHLWESINGAGSWDANPWVWVVEFKRVAP